MAVTRATTEPDPTTGSAEDAFFRAVGLRGHYGQSYVVQNVSFSLREGETLALLGRNGAGKTSTLRAIARLDAPHLTSGQVWLDGLPLHTRKAWQAAREGVGLVPEDRRIIQGLSVQQNLELARIAPPRGWSLEEIFELFPRLGERRNQDGTTLSGGEQQMLAIARTLARKVRLLLLDEPFEGLAPVIVQDIEKTLHHVRGLGMTTIIVEQNAIAALNLADRAVILDMGEVAFDGSARAVLDDAALRREYLAV